MLRSNMVYIIVIIFITLIFVLKYLTSVSNYNYELDRIDILERELLKKNRQIRMARSQTIRCPNITLKTPRSCYIDSNFTCSWNEVAERCNLIK